MPYKSYKIARIGVLISYSLFIAVLLLNTLWLNRPQEAAISLVLMIFVFPALLPIRGILHEKSSTHILAGLLSLIYFAHAFSQLVVPELLMAGILQSLASFLFFSFCMFFSHCVYKIRLLEKSQQDSC